MKLTVQNNLYRQILYKSYVGPKNGTENVENWFLYFIFRETLFLGNTTTKINNKIFDKIARLHEAIPAILSVR